MQLIMSGLELSHGGKRKTRESKISFLFIARLPQNSPQNSQRRPRPFLFLKPARAKKPASCKLNCQVHILWSRQISIRLNLSVVNLVIIHAIFGNLGTSKV